MHYLYPYFFECVRYISLTLLGIDRSWKAHSYTCTWNITTFFLATRCTWMSNTLLQLLFTEAFCSYESMGRIERHRQQSRGKFRPFHALFLRVLCPKIFFKNILLHIPLYCTNDRLSIIRLVHTFIMTRAGFFSWICINLFYS